MLPTSTDIPVPLPYPELLLRIQQNTGVAAYLAEIILPAVQGTGRTAYGHATLVEAWHDQIKARRLPVAPSRPRTPSTSCASYWYGFTSVPGTAKEGESSLVYRLPLQRAVCLELIYFLLGCSVLPGSSISCRKKSYQVQGTGTAAYIPACQLQLMYCSLVQELPWSRKSILLYPSCLLVHFPILHT